jgi:predicted metalloprotease with PDZ domain
LWSADDFRENLAWVASYLDLRSGRRWRPLIDTAVSAHSLFGARAEWGDWRRRTDFYSEMILVWLEADALIRQKTGGMKSLDDFCKRFHGGQSGPPEVKTYTFEEVVSELNAICPNDWKAFFQTRVYDIAPRAPLAGLEASGWRLSFTEQPNQMLQSGEIADKYIDLRFTLGLMLKKEGAVQDVIPGLPAAEAGVAPGMKLIAVNGRRWSEKLLREAIAATKNQSNVELLMENADFIKNYTLKYKGGERYPHLERDQSKPDLLQEVIRPRSSSS